MNKLICHTEGNECYIHEDVNIQNVNFMAIKKPMNVTKNETGIVLNFFGSSTYGSYQGIHEEFDNANI